MAQSCPTLCGPVDYSSKVSSVHEILQARKNTGVGSHSLLQGILLTQASNPALLRYRQILYHLSHREGLFLSLNVFIVVKSHILFLKIFFMWTIFKVLIEFYDTASVFCSGLSLGRHVGSYLPDQGGPVPYETFCPIEQIFRYHQRDRGGSARGMGLKPSCPCGHHGPVLCTRLAASLDL